MSHVNDAKLAVLVALYPPAPAYIVQDTFSGVDTTLLTAHTPDISPDPTWSVFLSAGGIQPFLYGNTVSVGRGGNTQAYAWIDSGESDVIITCQIQVHASSNFGLTFRVIDSSNLWFIEGDDAGGWGLYERTGGSITPRDTGSISVSTSTWYEAVVTLSGTSISATWAGGNELTYTSSQHQAGTSHGLYGAAGLAADGSHDDFTVIAS